MVQYTTIKKKNVAETVPQLHEQKEKKEVLFHLLIGNAPEITLLSHKHDKQT